MNVRKRDSRDLKVNQRKGEYNVELQHLNEATFKIQYHGYIIQASRNPQDLQLILSVDALEENSNACLTIYLCEMEGSHKDVGMNKRYEYL